MIDEVYSEPILKALLADMSNEEKVKIERSVDAFTNDVTVPLVDVFEKAFSDPEVIKELKRQLGNSQKVVLK